MRIGVMSGATRLDSRLDGLVARAKDLEARGFSTIWAAHVFGLDAITALAVVGRETARIELGTAVVPSYPRHPVGMAQQCLTAQVAARGRFALGVGLSHEIVIEGMLGLSYEKPARHMREYMAVLGPLLRGEPAVFEGEHYRVNLGLDVAEADPVPVIVAAMGDHMLRIAGRTAAGTILWMTGPDTIEHHIVPKLRAAAREAGRPEPRVVAGVPIVLTNDPDSARARIAKMMAVYRKIPSYRAMLDKEGAAGPADVSLAGDEKALDAGLARLRDAGVTDLNAAIIRVEDGADERTLEYLQSRL